MRCLKYIDRMSPPQASNQQRLHHLVWELNMAMVPLMETTFADSELTLALAGTLDEIATTPGATAADIARRGMKTQQAISQAVAKLEKLGFVERRLGAGRGVGLYLTATGEAANADGVDREQQMESRLRDLLGAEVSRDLIGVLTRARPRLFHNEDLVENDESE
jgi:DNA-binding MarR family transcriptional regulator